MKRTRTAPKTIRKTPAATAPAAPAVLPLGVRRRPGRRATAVQDAALPHAGLVDALAQAIDASAPEAAPDATQAATPKARRPRSPRQPSGMVRGRDWVPQERSEVLVIAETIDDLERRLALERARLLALLTPAAAAPARTPRPRRPLTA